MQSLHFNHVIIGGGLAAGYAAQIFGAADLKPDDLAIFSRERVPPYERPPLSKAFLAGEEKATEILINEPEFYLDKQIHLFLETPVTRVDLAARKLFTADREVSFNKLLIATGSRPRTFAQLGTPGADLAGIHYLRRLPDARQIRAEIRVAERAVVIGGSFIGLEVASVLARRGLETTLVFPEDRVWAAFFTPEMSRFFSQYYRDKGVTIRAGSVIEAFAGEAGQVQAVQLKDGSAIPADFVVAGIGVQPNIELFEDSPLQLNDGIQVDQYLATNQPDIYAAGDVAEFYDLIFDRQHRLEHWDNAFHQGQHAARMMLGQREPYQRVAYFFSDVFDLSYEFWGDPEEATEVVYRGDMEAESFSVWWLKGQRLVAAFVLNRPDDERTQAPQWIKSAAELDNRALADAAVPLADVRVAQTA
ncbi:MAG: FAD-dependent oxidoreductase [Anaerolineales bacterium]|nr:FAD-dependent oxidoreductase [Anaerolineales bacterium]